jgi:hypothetical protein
VRLRSSLQTWWTERRLSPEERRASRSERQTLAQMRLERDAPDTKLTRKLAADAESRRVSKHTTPGHGTHIGGGM